MARPSEAETEAEFIYPVLALLGWHHLPQQEPGRGRRDIADALLFLDEARQGEGARPAALRGPVPLGAVVVENEARDTPLDRASGKGEAPSSQIIRYLSRAEGISGGAVRWGLLTSGRFWRLYWAGARARAEGFVELDLPALLGTLPPPVPPGAAPDHWLRVFLLLFGRGALVPEGAAGRTFLDDALAEGRHYEQRITAALSRVVFDEVFPALVSAVGREAPARGPGDPAFLAAGARGGVAAALSPLFLLYAEDRDLLPVRQEGYAPYSLRDLREEAARVVDERRASRRGRGRGGRGSRPCSAPSRPATPAMGLPPYNGGLFDDGDGLLARLALPDAVLAPLLDKMSREGDAGGRRWINYRDLSVQQLGSIYERLLERDPVPDGRAASRSAPTPSRARPRLLLHAGRAGAADPAPGGRPAARASGARRSAPRRTRSRATGGPRPSACATLAPLDPAEAFASLRILDPAMGSGHFLVCLVDYLADEVLLAIAEAPAAVAVGGRGGALPLAARPPHRAASRAHPGRGGGERLARPRGPARRPPPGPPDHPQAGDLRRGHEPHGRRAGEALPLAALLHRRRAALLPRPPPPGAATPCSASSWGRSRRICARGSAWS